MRRAIIRDGLHDRRGNRVGGRDRGLHVHDQNGVIGRIGQQDFQSRRVARRIGVADDVDRVGAGPGWRKHGVELGAGRRGNRRRNAAKFGQPIDCQHADATAIGQDRQPLAGWRPDPAEGLGAVEQFAQIGDAKHARAAEGGVINRVGTGERSGMRRRRLRPLRHAAGLDDDHRLDPGRRPRRRHEFAGVLDGLDIEQDRLGLAIEREIIEQIRDIDVELIANRDHTGEAHAALLGPAHHPGDDRAGLRDQRQITRARHGGGKGGIQPGAGHHHADAVRPDDSHVMAARRVVDLCLERARTMAQPR